MPSCPQRAQRRSTCGERLRGLARPGRCFSRALLCVGTGPQAPRTLATAPPLPAHPPVGPALEVTHSPRAPGTQVLPPPTQARPSPACGTRLRSARPSPPGLRRHRGRLHGRARQPARTAPAAGRPQPALRSGAVPGEGPSAWPRASGSQPGEPTGPAPPPRPRGISARARPRGASPRTLTEKPQRGQVTVS